ncbi:MAG: type VI secretion system tube protein Hcp [Burkholderiales bacterium]|nr:type VI secretion system tube protein Hcp [Burkholderiales bacterium]
MKTPVTCAVLLTLAATLTPAAHAANSYLLSLDGIQGTSTIKGFETFIPIDSWSFGLSTPVLSGSGGAGAGKSKASPFSWTQSIDASVPHEFLDVASGKHLQTATLDVLSAGADGKPHVTFQMSFKDIVLTSLDLSGGASGSTKAALSLMANQLTMTYWEQKPNGGLGTPVVGSWNFKANTFSGSPLALQGLLVQQAAAVPEPQDWALAAVGLSVVGLSLRRKCRAQS